jgi:hypothetical protein
VHRQSRSASGQPHAQLLIKGIASLSIVVSLLGVGIHGAKIVSASTPYTTAVLDDSPSVFYETSEANGDDGAYDASGNDLTGTYGSALVHADRKRERAPVENGSTFGQKLLVGRRVVHRPGDSFGNSSGDSLGDGLVELGLGSARP